jgi:serine phosphatase RsbU (regulator of sigma subunit)
LINNAGIQSDPALWSNPEMSIQADSLGARAYRQAAVLRGGESGEEIQRAIPLTIPGRNPVGVVIVSHEFLGQPVNEQRERDLELTGYLNQAARALQAVGTRRQELILAGRMQASLLPEVPPSRPGWGIAAAWRPALETSGDFYDFLEFPNGRIGLVLADVTDKGMGAALYMALSRTLLRTYSVEYPEDPAMVLQAANQRMLADTQGGLFVTLFYGLLDPDTGVLTYCNAGHNPPYHIKAQDEAPPTALATTGIPLGMSLEATWEIGTLHLEPGDSLLLYTDGVVDANNQAQESFGGERLLEIAVSLKHRSAQDVLEAILSGVRTFTGNEKQFDDLTLVLIKSKY